MMVSKQRLDNCEQKI